MDWKLFLQLVVTAVVALTGGWAAHRFTARRDLLNERRKMRIAYLLEAYRKLEDASNRDDPERTWPKFESAIADIQLLGSPEQVALARSFALDMAQHSTAPLDPLVNDLRRSLREELELLPVKENVVYLRIGKKGVVRFGQTLSATIRNVDDAKAEGAALAPPTSRKRLEEREVIGEHTAQIVQAWEGLERIVRDKLSRMGEPDAASLSAAALLTAAHEAGVLTDAQQRSLRGLNTMRNLAVHGREADVDAERTEDFLALADAMKVVLEITDDERPG